MSYQVLARKYRPKNFAELIGQSHVARALSHAIDQNRVHHAYLFTGTRGVGKTTIARIFAKCLNCENGVSSTPCGICSTCRAIDAGQFIDLIEIDAASKTKVEDTRELLENVPYMPVQGRFKVYLIDEVHMLSSSSFNALLKTLEEPPAHVKFLLATTDPQKLPITVRSRCLQFVLRPLPASDLMAHLQKVLTAEKVAFDESALWQLADSAQGSVRDALSLTDQAVAFGGGRVSENTVLSMLGLLDKTDLLRLIGQLYANDLAGVQVALMQMRAQMIDSETMCDAMLEALHNVALLQVLPDMPLFVNDTQADSLHQLALTMDAAAVQLYYDILQKTRAQLFGATAPLQVFEMGILRLLAFRPLGVDESVLLARANAPNAAPTDLASSVVEQKVVDTDDDIKTNMPNSIEHDGLNDNLAAKLADDLADPPNFVNQTDAPINDNLPQDAENVGDLLPDAPAVPMTDSTVNTVINRAVINHDEMGGQNSADADHQKQMDVQISSQAYHLVNKAADNRIDNQATSQSKPPAATPVAIIDGRAPAPAPLDGEWTPEKWDYWLHTQTTLAPDEMAMASAALAQGIIGGVVTLITDRPNVQTQMSLRTFLPKFIAEFGGEVHLQQGATGGKTPLVLAEQRQVAYEDACAAQLAASAVVQRLQALKLGGGLGSLKLLS